MHISFAPVSIAGRFCLEFCKKLFCEGDQYITPTTIGLVLGKRISRKIFSIFSGKYFF